MRGIVRGLPALASAAALLALPAVASAALTGNVEAINVGEYSHAWSPEHVNLSGAGTVVFANKSTSVPHGIYWTSATQPACEAGVPVGLGKSGYGWSGSCSFAKAGAYTYYCTVHGAAMSGSVQVAGTPEASTEAAGETTQTGATLHGTVKPEGNAIEYRFEYGSASVSEHSTAALALGAEDFVGHSVSASVSGLAPSTTYRVRLTVLYGEAHTTLHAPNEQELTTTAPLAPLLGIGPVAAGETQATLKGTVDPEGEATEYFFEYGLREAPYASTATVTLPADAAVHAVSAPVAGLTPGSEYGYRLIARNGTGESEATGAFLTASPPAKEEKPSTSPPSPSPTPIRSSPGTAPLLAPAPGGAASAGFGPGLIAGSLRLSAHGAGVRGSIGIGRSGAGGRLEIDLLAKPAALGARGSRPVVVGRLMRPSVSAGTLSFSIVVSSRARLARRRHHRLSLTATATLTPTVGGTTRLTRALTLPGR